MKLGLTAKLVMPGHSSLPCADCVNLSALPAIHVFSRLVSKDVDARDKPGHDGLLGRENTEPMHVTCRSARLRDFPVGGGVDLDADLQVRRL